MVTMRSEFSRCMGCLLATADARPSSTADDLGTADTL